MREPGTAWSSVTDSLISALRVVGGNDGHQAAQIVGHDAPHPAKGITSATGKALTERAGTQANRGSVVPLRADFAGRHRDRRCVPRLLGWCCGTVAVVPDQGP
ncbi:hypothetical protein WR43_08830 [Mycolicibacter arupensis]|uniref:Uncharacterized protein n=1 Tax=Mycolicibacter arupensis TaxID=342002 RepID=A0A0F5MY12_9MYCO|nr:hypothetical protein WR43_08830 [Mycolicibacter arupensis]